MKFKNLINYGSALLLGATGCASTKSTLDYSATSPLSRPVHLGVGDYMCEGEGARLNLKATAGIYAGDLETHVEVGEDGNMLVSRTLSKGTISMLDPRFRLALEQAARDADLDGNEEITRKEAWELSKRVNRDLVESWRSQ